MLFRSVRNALSVRRNHAPDCGWNFEQISIGALYICSEIAILSPLALVMVWYSCGGIRLPALPGPACMPPAARKRKRSPSRSSSSYWVISSSPSQTPSTHHRPQWRSEEHTSELQSLMRNSYAVFCLKKQNQYTYNN